MDKMALHVAVIVVVLARIACCAESPPLAEDGTSKFLRIHVGDQLGVPVVGLKLQVKTDARKFVGHTDADGNLCVELPDGTNFTVVPAHQSRFFPTSCEGWISAEDADVAFTCKSPAWCKSATRAATALVSPNGFIAPQCTWWADTRANETGWRLGFSQSWGRDAYTWPTLLVNKKITATPVAGGLIVFSPWSGSAVGHVAFVEAVNGLSFTVTHSNFAIGTPFRVIGTTVVRQATMSFAPPLGQGYAKFSSSSTIYKVTYLSRK